MDPAQRLLLEVAYETFENSKMSEIQKIHEKTGKLKWEN